MAATWIERPPAYNERSKSPSQKTTASSVVSMNNHAEDTTQELQGFVASLEDHPALERALNRQLQIHIHRIKRQQMGVTALVSMSTFVVGALLMLLIMSIAYIH